MGTVIQTSSIMEHIVTYVENYLINLFNQNFSWKQSHVKIVKPARVSPQSYPTDIDWESLPINVAAVSGRQRKNFLLLGSFGETESDSEFSSTEDEPEYHVKSKRKLSKKIKKRKSVKLMDDDLIFNLELS